MRTCPCGSGLPRQERKDGYGIFLTFACDRCEARKLKGFRPDIFTRYQPLYGERIEPED